MSRKRWLEHGRGAHARTHKTHTHTVGERGREREKERKRERRTAQQLLKGGDGSGAMEDAVDARCLDHPAHILGVQLVVQDPLGDVVLLRELQRGRRKEKKGRKEPQHREFEPP